MAHRHGYQSPRYAARSPFRWTSKGTPRRPPGRRFCRGLEANGSGLTLGLLTVGVQSGRRRRWSAQRRIVDDAVARYRLPGIAVGVCETASRLPHARRTPAGDAHRSRQSLFKIASNSEGDDRRVLARLVDQGKLRWDDPVTRYLPQFRMHDPWVTREMQVRDLLVHNSGLPEGGGDLMFWPEPNLFTRARCHRGARASSSRRTAFARTTTTTT